mmetsp:Transcript_112057/g.327747  ORF Transcript_112057/g.327747 Transcript_112057/m.327747 type:complete len:668 (-) Transcript_112057:182-2185(-)
MEPLLGSTPCEDRLAFTDPPRLHVKNTFIEVDGDSDDSLDLGDSWMRASTEPAKVFSVRPSPGVPELAGVQEPKYVYPKKAPAADAAAREAPNPAAAWLPAGANGGQLKEEWLRILESDPELAPVFESVKKGGLEAASLLFQNESLMQKISRKVDELKLPKTQQMQPVARDGSVDLSGIMHALAGMEEHVVQRVTVSAIRNMPCSVTLADPALEDCPLIGCSEGFEALTGYSAKEVVGQNCRFLSRGLIVEPGVRRELREAVCLGRDFVGVLPNTRKNGEPFSNLLRLTTTFVRRKRYIIGIQADVTNIDIDLSNSVHMEELKGVARRIFSCNVDAWVQMQARQFSIRQPIPYSDILKADSPQQFQEAQGQFVVLTLGADGGRLQAEREDNLKKVPSNGSSPVPGVSEQSTAASVTRGDLSEESADGSRPAETGGPLRSIGSAGHPDKCNNECIFYFFRDGCRAGEDCRFCHEFHRRKNMKKNRRILRRLCGEAPGAAPSPEGAVAAEAEATAEEEAAEGRLEEKATVGAVRYWYGEEHAAGQGKNLTLVTGQCVHLPAHVQVDAEKQQGLQDCLNFSVWPALPPGLEWDTKTGLISGTPEKAQPPAVHTFTASIAATGPGGIDLGQVHLASCQFSLGVVDLRQFALSWGDLEASGTSLTLKLKASP